jgi:hypothetical protein
MEFSGATARAFAFKSDDDIVLPLYLVEPDDVQRTQLKRLVVQVLDGKAASKMPLPPCNSSTNDGDNNNLSPTIPKSSSKPIRDSSKAFAYVAPRGIGPTAWNSDAKEQVHIRRRFMLLGQTLDGMRVWDVRRAIQSLRRIDGLADVPIVLIGHNEMSGVALYAALFEPNIEAVELINLAKSHRDGPDFLNVMRFLDVPQAVAMVAEKSHVVIYGSDGSGWEYPLAVAKRLGWKDRIEFERLPEERNRPTAAASSR